MEEAFTFAFLHGGGQGAWVWDETRAALAQQTGGAARTIAFDLPGCGSKRGTDVSTLTVRDVAKIFTAELADAKLGPCILIGHSNAGTILPLVAQSRPDLVRHLIYISCIAPPPGQNIGAVMRPRHAIGAAAIPSAERLRQMFCNDMTAPQAEDFMAKLGFDHWPTQQALAETAWQYGHLQHHSAGYIFCLQDEALPLPWQEEFATRLHATRHARIDAGHQVMNTRPQTLAEILRFEAAAL